MKASEEIAIECQKAIWMQVDQLWQIPVLAEQLRLDTTPKEIKEVLAKRIIKTLQREFPDA